MSDPKEFYPAKILECSARLKAVKQRSIYVSLSRLAAFVLLAVAIYFSFLYPGTLPAIGMFVFVILFVMLVRTSASLSEKKRLLTQLLFINTNELRILNNGNNAFDDGSMIIKQEMHAADLDIFGKKSVYHLLNRTTTAHGAQSLSRLLNHPLIKREDITGYQQAVVRLAPQVDERQLITAHGLAQEKEKDNNDNIDEIVTWLGTADRLVNKKWLNILRYSLPAATVAGLLLYLSASNPVLLGSAVVFNWLLIGFAGRYTLQQHTLMGKKEAVLQQYGTILKQFLRVSEAGSDVLTGVKATAADAHQEILRLSRLSNLFDQRLNLVVNLFLNSLFLYDIQIMIALEKWKRKNSRHFLTWIGAVGEIEKLNSLATFHFNHPDYCMPSITEGKPFVSAESVGHPLIPRSAQVANDITAGHDEKLLLITGSNMSGKSTFLRTIGVNVLLAQCGLPVCATSFSFTPVHILSSIRISDSLQENTSYFMAELKRLKEIIEFLMGGGPALVLIDEVLRGTNSDDKTYGSEELIRRLSSFNCIALFASHDLSLSVLEGTFPGQVKNYCFESTISDGELLFDYQLRRGVATNKNASFLMKKMGIIV